MALFKYVRLVSSDSSRQDSVVVSQPHRLVCLVPDKYFFFLETTKILPTNLVCLQYIWTNHTLHIGHRCDMYRYTSTLTEHTLFSHSGDHYLTSCGFCDQPTPVYEYINT